MVTKQKKDRIVFLDAGSVDWGDLSLSELARLGDLTVYPQTESSKIEARSRGAQIIVTNKCRLTAKILSSLKHLKLICVAATGINNIDLDAARHLRIAVTNVPGYSTETVVQFTFSFLLSLACNLRNYDEAAHDGRWSQSRFFTLPSFPVREISGKVLGIVGYGKIGRRVAQAAKIFGMKVLVAQIPGRRYSAKEKKGRVSWGNFLRQSDFVTLHAPLTPLTQNLIDAKALGKMKKKSFLINMARGGLVNEKALDDALRSGHLAGAAADVLSEEPPPKNHLLLKVPNFILTPHVAWASREARARLVYEMALNIKAFRQGKRRNRAA